MSQGSAASESNDEMQNTSSLDVVLVGGAIIGELFAAEDESLLLGVNAGLLLDTLLNAPDSVGRINVDFGLVAGEKLDFDKHCCGAGLGWKRAVSRGADV
eukprot:gb/GEZJ01002395.1/.p4 GENE.gb/GEZJ01002395.1/~~gb/GEZJ01002395.1/.p4  ORF type:complete len:100 (+),score=15.57 gb/GEZJ01002395.1/:1374-1673(+)